MANNRTEQQALIDALAPTVDLVELQAALVQAGYVFKKDVITTVAASGGLATASFATSDQVKVTTSADVAITISGLENGQVSKLIVEKGSSNLVSFSGVAGESIGQQKGLTELQFLVWSADTVIYVKQINAHKTGSFVAGDITFTGSGTITGFTVEYFNWEINNNILTFNAALDVNVGAITPPSTLTMEITSRNMGTFNVLNKNISMSGYAASGSVGYLKSNFIDNGTKYTFNLVHPSGLVDSIYYFSGHTRLT